MIPNEQVVITISHAGYIKRTSLTEYKTQNRGGVGQKASTTRNEDFLEHLICRNKPPIYVILSLKKENVSGCVFMKYQKEVKHLKESDSKLNKY